MDPQLLHAGVAKAVVHTRLSALPQSRFTGISSPYVVTVILLTASLTDNRFAKKQLRGSVCSLSDLPLACGGSQVLVVCHVHMKTVRNSSGGPLPTHQRYWALLRALSDVLLAALPELDVGLLVVLLNCL